MERVHFPGRLDHGDLPALLSASQAEVVPSTFPEAFGMVAVEAAACGALPISAGHSGLHEISSELAPALDRELRGLLSFDLSERPVEAIAERLVEWLSLPEKTRVQARSALSRRARERYGWDRVADGVLAAADGRLDLLRSVTSGRRNG